MWLKNLFFDIILFECIEELPVYIRSIIDPELERLAEKMEENKKCKKWTLI